MNFDNNLLNTVALGALLHDIGKLLQKGSFGSLNMKGKHPEISGNFVRAYKNCFSQICDANLLETLVEKHHESSYFPSNINVKGAKEEYKPLAYMLSRADNYSSTERDEDYEGYKNFKTRPLDSVITRLKLTMEEPQIKQYKPMKYSTTSILPVEQAENNEEELNALLKEFGNEVKELMEKTYQGKVTFKAFYYKIETLLLKYSWCIPSNSQERIADISLFDHLKTTSAIACCLYLYHKDKEDFSLKSIKDDNTIKFNLAVADLSGIQSYIYEGLSMSSGNVAKRLRARSFNINMIMEYAAKKIIDTFGLFHSNVLISTGGKIYVLLPNCSDYNDKLAKCKSQLEKFLFRQYRGLIALNFASIPLSGNDFDAKSFGEKMTQLSKQLAWEKKKPFSSIFVKEGKWQEEIFMLSFKGDQSKEFCSGCNREYSSNIYDDRHICSWCESEIKQGTKIPNTIGVKFFDNDEEQKGFRLLDDKELLEVQMSNDLYIAVNKISGLDGVYLSRNMANHVPVKGDQSIKTFQEIAQESNGAQNLAYLKADVDNLGSLFSFGLNQYSKDGIKYYSTISRITTMSRMFEMFFSGTLNTLIEDSYKDCYIVYSGGDDFLIIGPWDQILALSLAIRNCFAEFSGNNPNITLSAGIIVVKPKTPVVKAVEWAEKQLESSKELIRRDCDKNRNQITIFDRTMSWTGFENALLNSQNLVSWVNKGIANHSDMYKLKKFDEMFQKYYKTNDTTGLMYVPLLNYDIGRKEKHLKRDEEEKSCEYLTWLKNLKNITSETIFNLRVVVDIAILASK